MAKKPLKISEILAKKSSPPAESGALDFIAESQNLINQYTKESAVSSEVELFGSIRTEVIPIEAKDEEVQPSIHADTNLLLDTNKTEHASLNAHISPLLGTDLSPSTSMGISKNEPLKASFSNSNNSETDPEQLRNNSVTESGTITEQLRNSSVIKAEQLRNKTNSNSNNCVTNEKQLRNSSVTESGTSSVTVTEQLRNNSVTNLINPPHANRLAGNKLTIVRTILDFCQERGSANTGPVSREVFENRTGIDGEVIRVTCMRLVKEGYLNVLESKRGNGGYTVYELHPTTHSQLISGYIRNNYVTIPEQKRNNSVTESVTESVTNASSKIDSKNYNNLTNYLEPSSTTATWFKELDFSKVSPIGPMLVNATIRSLVQQKLNPEVVQDFLNRFTSWVATQSRVSNMVGLFCDKLKELANEGDSPVLACMTEEERQIELAYAAQVEKARAELDLIQKARALEREKIQETDFENWYSTASESEKEHLVPSSHLAPEGSEARKRLLRATYLSKAQSE